MKKYKNVIWDWNGTILNDLDICVDIANDMLKKHGNLNLTTEHYQSVFGFPITDYYKKIGIDLEEVSMEVLTEYFITNYMAKVKDCQLHQDINSVLNHFHKGGLDQYILTAAHK